MSEGTEQTVTPGGKAGPEPRRGSALLAVAALLVGLVVGGAAGFFVAGPAVSAWLASGGSAGEASHGGDHGDDRGGGHGGGHGGGKSGSGGETRFSVENLVVNPADSRGTRFLMATVVFEIAESSAADDLRGREAQVRDVLSTLLASKTIEQLSSVGTRDSLRTELRDALQSLTRSRVGAVFLPQFVIQ